MKSVGIAVKNLSNEIFRFISATFKQHFAGEYSPMQILFVHYIGNNQPAVYQRDLEQNFNIRRSTATGILQHLEKSAVIERTSSPTDGRLKTIQLTATGAELHQQSVAIFQEINQQLARNISAADLQTFFQVIDQIYQNTEEGI